MKPLVVYTIIAAAFVSPMAHGFSVRRVVSANYLGPWGWGRQYGPPELYSPQASQWNQYNQNMNGRWHAVGGAGMQPQFQQQLPQHQYPPQQQFPQQRSPEDRYLRREYQQQQKYRRAQVRSINFDDHHPTLQTTHALRCVTAKSYSPAHANTTLPSTRPPTYVDIDCARRDATDDGYATDEASG